MTEDDFWQLIEDSRRQAGGSQEGQVEEIICRLEQLPTEELKSFEWHSSVICNLLNNWGVKGAFNIVYREFAFSNDLYIDFISAIIMQGKEEVAGAIESPDLIKADSLDACEEFIGCALKAWVRQHPERKKSEYVLAPPIVSKQPWRSEPFGTAIDVSDVTLLKSLYPRLWARFWGNPKKPLGVK